MTEKKQKNALDKGKLDNYWLGNGTQTTLYRIEPKLNKSAETAMKLIELKDYPSRSADC